MTPLERILAQFPDLDSVELTSWIERRWVQPEASESGGWEFHEIDVARVHLIYDLRRDIGVAEETLPVVLSLVDQLYAMRRSLKSLHRALEGQPPDIRQALLTALGEDRGGDKG
jgi:chaperone modulatory protein CbpM